MNFGTFTDADGHGIAVDDQYVYLTAQKVVHAVENGVNGVQPRLYIGQYRAISDNEGIPPVVSITAPASGSDVREGSSITVEVEAVDDIAVSLVRLLLDGVLAGTDGSAPYQFDITAPLINGGVPEFTLSATVIPGIILSSKIRSGRCPLATSIALVPSEAVQTA